MLELIALAVAATGAVLGHIKSRNFTRSRLRWTSVARHPGLSGLVAGAATVILTAPLMGLLPLLGGGTAIALGAGVGTGVATGARRP